MLTRVSPFAVPSAAPDDVAVEVVNSSVVKVSWVQVQKDKLHGHLGGYRVIFEKKKQTFALRCSFKGLSVTLHNTVSTPPPPPTPSCPSSVHKTARRAKLWSSFIIFVHFYVFA